MAALRDGRPRRDAAIAAMRWRPSKRPAQERRRRPSQQLLGGNVLRNTVGSDATLAAAPSQSLDYTILLETDSYARSETYTQLETGAAEQRRHRRPGTCPNSRTRRRCWPSSPRPWCPTGTKGRCQASWPASSANYATSSSVTSAISSALSSYDNSSQVDSKIITALLDFYTRAEVDQEIADALGNVDLSSYYTSAQTDSLFYPRTELDSLLTATLLQYWTSGRTQTEIDDAIAGAGFLTQAQADTRYFAVSANGSFESLVRTNVTPPQIKALLPRAPLAANTILTDTTLELTCDAYTKAEADGRYLSSSNFTPLDARYFARNPAVAEGNGLFHLVQEQFTPRFIRSLLFRPLLTGGAILGNGVIEIEADCWSKAQSDGRYPLVATFNSLGSTVTSIDGRVSTLETDVGAQQPHRHHLRGDAPAAERSGRPPDSERPGNGPQGRRRAAGQLRRRRHQPGQRRDGGRCQHPERHHGGHHPAHRGQHGGHGRLQLQQQRHRQPGGRQQPPRRSPAGALRPDRPLAHDRRGCAGRPGQRHPPGQRGHRSRGQPAIPVPLRRHHGLEMNTKFAAVTGVGDPGGFCELAVINQAPTGVARLFLATNNNGAGGKGELVALASGGLQLNALNELMSFNTTSGLANMFIEPNTGGNNNGEVIFGYGHMNASDRKLKQNIRKIPQKQAQQLFDELEPKIYDRVEGPKDQIGFVAQDVLAAGELGKALCKPMGDGELLALDYQKLSVVLWGVVKSLQKRVDKLEKKRGRSN